VPLATALTPVHITLGISLKPQASAAVIDKSCRSV
jgi:hypothetical protein